MNTLLFSCFQRHSGVRPQIKLEPFWSFVAFWWRTSTTVPRRRPLRSERMRSGASEDVFNQCMSNQMYVNLHSFGKKNASFEITEYDRDSCFQVYPIQNVIFRLFWAGYLCQTMNVMYTWMYQHKNVQKCNICKLFFVRF